MGRRYFTGCSGYFGLGCLGRTGGVVPDEGVATVLDVLVAGGAFDAGRLIPMTPIYTAVTPTYAAGASVSAGSSAGGVSAN